MRPTWLCCCFVILVFEPFYQLQGVWKSKRALRSCLFLKEWQLYHGRKSRLMIPWKVRFCGIWPAGWQCIMLQLPRACWKTWESREVAGSWREEKKTGMGRRTEPGDLAEWWESQVGERSGGQDIKTQSQFPREKKKTDHEIFSDTQIYSFSNSASVTCCFLYFSLNSLNF